MKAALLYGASNIKLEDVDMPEMGDDQALVRVHAVGICGSDIHLFDKGKVGSFVIDKPLILGHECSGEVYKIGKNVRNVRIGDRVTVEPSFPCKKCSFCKNGKYNLCNNLRFLGLPGTTGAFSKYIAADADFLYKISDSLSYEEGSLMEPLSVGIHASRLGNVSIGKNVAILGAGPIGLCTLQAAIVSGASKVIITDIKNHLLECAKRLGATEVVNVKDEDPIEKVQHLTGGKGVDIVFEAVGSRNTIRQSFDIVMKGGTVAMIGALVEDKCLIKMLDIHLRDLTFKGIFRYVNTFSAAIESVNSGKIKLKPLITHVFPLEGFIPS
jgi:L-iditol 2-dehydrogenase